MPRYGPYVEMSLRENLQNRTVPRQKSLAERVVDRLAEDHGWETEDSQPDRTILNNTRQIIAIFWSAEGYVERWRVIGGKRVTPHPMDGAEGLYEALTASEEGS